MEAGESEYWIGLLNGEYLSEKEAQSLKEDVVEIIKLLTSITKKTEKK